MNWIKEQGELLGRFFTDGFRRTAYWCAGGMLLAAVLGAGAGLLFPEQAMAALNAFMEQIEQSGVVSGEGEISVFPLLMNNWRAMLISILYGFIPFLFLPVLSLISNGALLGLLAAVFVDQGAPVAAFLAGILPHGIFELSALILSIACGVTLCRHMCRMVCSDPDRRPLPALLEDLLRVLVLVIAPLTAIAAAVECYITPVVMGLI